jgi:precorrin-6B methylase 2
MLSFRKDLAGWFFDRWHGVDTNRKVPRDELTGMPRETRGHAGEYSPSNPSLIKRIVRESRVDPRHFVFVDLGCGKGRVLIAAAEYPFQSIVGIEADAALCTIARRNLERVHLNVESVIHADARTADLPQGNLFIFMYSPFRGPVFESVAQRLAAMAREPGRAIIVAYSADWEAEALERTGVFARVRLRRRQFWRRSRVSLFYNEAAGRMRR